MNEATRIPVVEGHIDGKAIRVDCPYCGRVHIHGYNTEAYPGHRISHCHLDKADAGYMVVVTN